MVEAKASGFYDISVESEIEWVQPKLEHTFMGVEDGFCERPTFLRCLRCSKTVQYSQAGFGQFSFAHGEMCQRKGD